ncbi:hypothetical protein ABT300_43630 [Streptomyces sp. NPDC001027]|uniref:hypothetical protein n=1 Tax=Streptomyces sp. NPDC001027 TaxID=3154771 RepID=UPI00331AB36E
MPTEPVTLLVVVLVVLPLSWRFWLSWEPELQLTRVLLTCFSAPVQVQLDDCG